MSQKELAEATGYHSRSAIAKIETGTNELPISKLLDFTRALDTTAEALLEGPGRVSTKSSSKTARKSKAGRKFVGLILAGGKSSRNMKNIPNQFINVLGKPVIAYSLEAYQKHPLIDDIYIVCLKGWEDIVKAYAKQYRIDKIRGIISAGDTGLLSIRNGAKVLSGLDYVPEDIVVIQETNRPFVTEEAISKVINSCLEKGSSVICEPLDDHLPFIKQENGSMRYVERGSVFSMQSPDAHTIETLSSAFDEAEMRKISLNKNAFGMLLSELGWPLHFCEGNRNNIKIVRQQDIAVFAALLKAREE